MKAPLNEKKNGHSRSLLRCSVSLAAIFEPIRDLRQRQAGLFGQGALLVGRRVAVLAVAVLECGA